MRQAALQQESLEAIARLCGASNAAMLIHMEPARRDAIWFATYGEGAPVAEMADEDTAWALIDTPTPVIAPAGGVHVVRCKNADDVLVRIDVHQVLARSLSRHLEIGERRRSPSVASAPHVDGSIWLGLRTPARLERLVEALESNDSTPFGMTSLLLRLTWTVHYLSVLLQDPVSQLPGRKELEVSLRRVMTAARDRGQPLALVLINPDDFAMINHRYGRTQGDLAVREVATHISELLRGTDRVFHYGGAVFAALLPATDADQCRVVAQKLRAGLTSQRYVDGDVALTFSVGAAVAAAEDLANTDATETGLLRRADLALNAAKLSGGGRCVVAELQDLDEQVGRQARQLGGMFAADTEKDYRNMLVLWETVALVAAHSQPDRIVHAFIDRLAQGFRPERVALATVDDGKINLRAANVRDDAAPNGRVTGVDFELDSRQSAIVFEALETERVARLADDNNGKTGTRAFAVPVVARERRLGVIYLDAGGRPLELDSSDVIFLQALATQMATAIDRAELAETREREKDRERRALREEVRGLRQVLHHTSMVYESPVMLSLMTKVRKIAPSDATVLITGESGTGKEVLARSIHELSDRESGPLVVFDCGAVAPSLIEAELFGHTKGAFTGADRASSGHIARADGGTLFLDEIGELPLQVQAKLLRFVQEREYSQVGSADVHKVNVRIVAATNRRLDDEVGAGRFRADLYYRLRVISLQAAPLRERREDIPPLARFFVDKFAAQRGIEVPQLDQGAEAKLLDYHWPGNVRELQHCLLRAVLTHDGPVLDADALELFPADAHPPPAGEPAHASRPATAPAPSLPNRDVAVPITSVPPSRVLPNRALREELDRQVAIAVQNNPRRPAPLGRWLTEDLVSQASDACGGIARRAAQRVGVPESTFRRQLDKLAIASQTGGDFRPPHWQPVPQMLAAVVEFAADSGADDDNLLELTRDMLLECVRSRLAGRVGAAAALMGVTPPTYKRWIQASGNHSCAI